MIAESTSSRLPPDRLWQPVTAQSLVTFNGNPAFQAGEQGARFLLVSGKPINEPVVQYGPFVMNSREEIDEAMRDFHSNNFVRGRAWINRNKKGELG